MNIITKRVEIQLDMYKVLRELSNVHGVAGDEKRTAEAVKDSIQKYTDDTVIDKFYNVIGYKRGSAQKKIMICTQIDEPGFIIDSITNNGFIKVVKIGEFDINAVWLNDVIVHGKKDIPGILVSRPAKLIKQESRKEIFIDTGLSKTELQFIVSIGDPVSLKIKPLCLKDDMILAKIKNNACGIMILTEIAERVFNMNLDCQLYYVGDSQKEIGCNGAIISANRIQPDLAIIIGKILETEEENESDFIGKGPIFCKSPYINTNYYNLLVEVANQENIPYQVEVQGGQFKKANEALQISNLGIPTISVGIPIRYKNSAIQTICVEDLENIERVIVKLLQKIGSKNRVLKE